MSFGRAIRRLELALTRARRGIKWSACAYLTGALVGLVAVHAGFQPALTVRDKLIKQAQATSPILKLDRRGGHATAASLDFAGNLVAATATGLAGWWAPMPLPMAAYRGWIGGIVSVDGRHRSRLLSASSAAYYLIVLGLQLSGYILVGGAGVNLGLSRTHGAGYGSARFLSVPVEAWRDGAWILALAVPIFALGSAVEFLWTP